MVHTSGSVLFAVTVPDPASNRPHPLVALGGPDLPGPAGAQAKSGALSPKVLQHTMTVAEALFSPNDVDPPPAGRMAFVQDEYADLMARSSWRGRLLFTWSARIVGRVGPMFIGRFVPISQLKLPDRIEALRRVEKRPIGGLLIALRALLCMVYYEHPESAREAGIGLGPGEVR